MTVTADTSWAVDPSFSVPHGEQTFVDRCDPRVDITVVENHEENPRPGLNGCPVVDFDIRERLETIATDIALDQSSDKGAKWNRVLSMWLSWSEAYEEITSRMYRDGEDTQELESLMDEMDQVRQEAVKLSESLLDY
tara:strand:- start:507 stop:917 length:411 start_codon:yes stop_codon:yes gene_type:complete